jgi:NADPH-dependent 2,4-dienoyl-CoA reductase/sulfur reductase-like enzyme
VDRIVIVGAGLAGAKTAEALRQESFTGHVTLIGDETYLPYERPPLSKDYLAGTAPFEEAAVHSAAFYAENDVDLRLGVSATEVDRAARQVRLADGSALSYDVLVLATGASPRQVDLAGADAPGVLTLRRRQDADAIRSTFGEGRALAIIGAGWIGLEVAAAARQAGTAVTVVEAAPLPLLGVLGAEMAEVFADLHREHGVVLHLGAKIEDIALADGHAAGLHLSDGSTVDAGAVVVGVGAAPNVGLALAAGLDVDNGVLVDAALRTSDPAIWAVGDVANHDHPVLGERIRVEHWANALNQPATAAKSILGQDVVYSNLPYFYSDQYDLGMEYVGYAPAGSYTQVVIRGDRAGRQFVAFWLDEGNHIKASMNVNVWDVVDEIKPLIAEKIPVDPANLADSTVPFASLR